MKYKNYYDILGVEKSASKDDIKKAYRKLAKKYHPDTNPEDKKAEENFKNINEAYEVLSDKDKKNKYDNMGQQFDFQGGHDFDPSQYGFGNNARYEYHTGSDTDFSDFFNAFFGGYSDFDVENMYNRSKNKRSAYSYSADGDNTEAEIEIDLKDGFQGTEKKISLRKGNETISINFKVPKGVKEGEKIRLRGQGKSGANGGKSGDLYLIVKFKKQKDFEIKDKNIYYTQELYPWEAALGEKKSINILDGIISVNIPPHIQSGKSIRVAGKGYIDKNGNRGDLFIKIKLMNPNRISNELKELFTKMKDISIKEGL
ncbi:MAG: DnaJ C-terminal domain-containing protein [Eubacteriaceae bacterium]